MAGLEISFIKEYYTMKKVQMHRNLYVYGGLTNAQSQAQSQATDIKIHIGQTRLQAEISQNENKMK